MKLKDRNEARVLKATIEFSYDRDQLALLAGDLPVAGMLNLEIPCPQTMQLSVSTSSWRLDLDEPTLFGSGMTLIHHRDGGAEFLDHETRTRLVLDQQDVPVAAVRRPGRWQVIDLSEADSESEHGQIEVVVDDPITGQRWFQRIRTRERCDNIELLRNFVEALLVGGSLHETSHYPLEQLVVLLARRGLPGEVSLYVEGADTAVSHITVTNVAFDAMSPISRRDARGYRDLRDWKTRKRWSKAGVGLLEVAARDLDEFRFFNSEQNSRGNGVFRIANNGRPDPEFPDPPEKPPARITTNAAQVGLRIEQRLLDDIQRTVNSIAAHLSAITTNGTDLLIHWLEDMVASARQLDPPDETGRRKMTVEGTGLAFLLHEDPGTGDIKHCLPEGGRGIIDRMAVKQSRNMLEVGKIPDHVLATLSPADQTAINTALVLSDPASRFESLTSRVRTRLIAAVAFEDIGTLRFSLSNMRDPINFHDLYMVKLTDFSVSLGFPQASTNSSKSLEAPLLSELKCRTGGEIQGTLSVDGLSLDATLVRTPLPLYWSLLIAGSSGIPLFFPEFSWVIPILSAISLFLATDFARLRLDARQLRATINVDFVPGPSSQALRPRVSVRIFGNIRTRMLSYIPDGIHQLVDWTVADFANQFGITLLLLEGQLGLALQKMLDRLMGDGVPGSLLRLGIPVDSGSAFGVDDQYVYLESNLGIPSNPAIRIVSTPVSAAMRFDLERDIVRTFGAGGGGGRGRHYISFAGSINAINQVATVLWNRGEFNTLISGGSAATLRSLLTPPFNGTVTRINIYHAAPPVFSLLPGGPDSPQHYFDLIFPSYTAVINPSATVTWRFRYRLGGRGAFGLGAVPQAGRFLSITGIRPNIFEMMLDSNTINATLLEATKVEKVTITVQDAGSDPRHPQVIRTHEEIIEETTDYTQAAPASWSTYGRGLFILGNSGRDAGLIPRLNQVKTDGNPSSWPLDTPSQQTYSIDGTDPDDATPQVKGINVAPYAQLPVDWGFIQGLSFAHVEVSGALQQVLSGVLHLNSLLALDALLLYPFLDRLPL